VPSADGSAIKTMIIATVPEPNITFERDELIRKLEKSEQKNRLLLKEKEEHAKDMSRMQKEMRLSIAEMQNLRDRNEQLQQSLMNSRLLSQNAREEADTRLSEARIRELEVALGASIHKCNKLESDVEASKMLVTSLQSKTQEQREEIDAIKDFEINAKETIAAAAAKAKAAQSLCSEYEREVEKARTEVLAAKQGVLNLQDKLNNKQREVDDALKQIEEQKEDIAKLRTSLVTRSETNSLLRAQMEEISGAQFSVTKEEMDKFKKLERDNASLMLRNKDLAKSVELHMSLLQRAESENDEHGKVMDKKEQEFRALKHEHEMLKKEKMYEEEKVKVAKKEIRRLLREAKEGKEQVDELTKNPFGKDEEVTRHLQALAKTTRERDEECAAKLSALKKAKIFEDTSKALRSRINFLLLQLAQASRMAVVWQEQKALLKG